MASPVTPVKLILDTDIGTDVDDAWALALCLASPELELLGVTLVHANVDVRAKIALKMLKLAGRANIPVVKGISEPLTPGTKIYWAGHEGTETDFSDIAELRAREDAVQFIIDEVANRPSEVVLCSIGPMSNVGEAVRRAPEIMKKLKRLVVMASSFEGYGAEKAAREHNACVDPVATKLVLESRIPATVVGLNVTKQVKISVSDLPQIEILPFGRYLSAMTRQYLQICGRDFTFMHDPLAVAAIINPKLVGTERMRAEVLDDGRVVFTRDEENGWLDVCTSVDAHSFESFLIERITARCESQADRKETH
ncbi:MAG: nucleoside hydrolase [Armatimonadota bacterium]|nr:nucleoside hydrolase [Armatimonadota bacterium]